MFQQLVIPKINIVKQNKAIYKSKESAHKEQIRKVFYQKTLRALLK